MALKTSILPAILFSFMLIGGCVVYENAPPVITSPTTAEATGGIYFSYHATYVDPDNTRDTVMYINMPGWLNANADSIYGIPPDGRDDFSFDVVVYDGYAADTTTVAVDMIPCMVVYGDSRTGHVYHQVIVDSLMTIKPAVVFHTGDLVNDGRIATEWVTFNTITATMRAEAEFYPSLGNHEQQSRLYFENFVLPGNEQWYSIDRYGVHFICLNSCIQTDKASEQYQWLIDDLESIHDSTRFVVAYFHHPPFSTGPHTEDEKGLRETWVPLFEQYGVDVVFNGHDHHYEKSYCGSIYYIVSGGGGAPLRDQIRSDPCSQLYIKDYHFCKLSVIGERMIVTVYDREKNVIDGFEINVEN